jgi:signal transduction histidine kinase
LVLLAVNLVILLIPISGVYLFRIYENELVRQTESELIAQGAVVSAMYKEAVLAIGGPDHGLRRWFIVPKSTEPLRFILPELDLARAGIDKRSLSFVPSSYQPDPIAVQAADRLAPVLAEATLTTLSTVTILDYHGLIVYGQRGKGLSLERNIEVARALEGSYASTLRHREVLGWISLSSASRGTPYRVFAALPVIQGQRLLGVIHLSRTPRDVLKALYQERRNIILSGAMVLILMVIVSLISALMIISPIKRLAKDSRLVAEGLAGDLENRTGGFLVVREVDDLRASVIDMAGRLKKRSDYLKAFSSGVSHEFKTPLASIKGTMEIINDHSHDMSPEVKEKFENNIRLDLERLEILTGRLLALARAEAYDPTGEEKTEATLAAKNLALRFLERYPQMKADIKVSPDDLKLWLALDGTVLETVLLNLWENSRENEADRIEVTLKAEGGLGRIEVRDNGRGLTKAEAEKIFTPFYTTRKNKGGTGLGLSLARTLLAPYRAHLDWIGPPAVFLVSVPLVKTQAADGGSEG